MEFANLYNKQTRIYQNTVTSSSSVREMVQSISEQPPTSVAVVLGMFWFMVANHDQLICHFPALLGSGKAEPWKSSFRL